MKKVKSYIGRILKKVKLFFYHLPNFSFENKIEKGRIVVCFDGFVAHGGLVDRLKGIISFYEIAKKLEYDFFIYFEDPFTLSHFLEPNVLDWRINNQRLKFNPFTTKILYLNDNFKVKPLQLIKGSRNKDFFVYANIDYLNEINPGFDKMSYRNLWKKNYDELFNKTSILEQAMAFLPNEKRIVFHSRFTNLLGDFKDTSNKIISEDEKTELLNKLLIKIEEVRQNSDVSKTIYILSDSLLFLQYISQKPYLKILEGTPKHIDVKSNKIDLEAHLKTFTDFYFMIESDEIYLLKLNKMYNSGFSRYASIIGNVKFTVIE